MLDKVDVEIDKKKKKENPGGFFGCFFFDKLATVFVSNRLSRLG